MKLQTGLALSLALFGLVACGGGPGSGPVSADDFREGCRIDCQHDFDCGDTTETVDACTERCFADFPEAGWLRGDAFVAISECFAELSCTADDDSCFTECSPTGAHDRWESQCREVFAPCITEPAQLDGICEVTPMPNIDDEVGFFCLFTPAIMDELTACIPDGTACEPGISCVQAALERHNIDL
jgi:hypothetical protein